MFLRRVYITAFIEHSVLAVYSGQMYSCIQKSSSPVNASPKCKDSMNLACQTQFSGVTHYRKANQPFCICRVKIQYSAS